ncbi:MAG: SRPBCC domain-containing protein [Thermomicrobiales bacterium]
MSATTLHVEATIDAPVAKVWEYYNDPERITAWNSASEDWHTPTSRNDVRTGGSFSHRMEARDGSQGFDFEGTYDEVVDLKKIAYTMTDGRHATVDFEDLGGSTRVAIDFDPENEFPQEFQQEGWQAILDAFKTYTEAH